MKSRGVVRSALAILTMSVTTLTLLALPAEAAGVASQLVVTTQPSTAATSGQPLTTQPVITVEDTLGNVVSTATGTVTASIASGSGTISAGETASITDGVATFSGLTITGATGTDTLNFVDGPLASATSWTGTTMSTSDDWYSVAYGNGVFVAVAWSSGVTYSTDGSTWTSANLPNSARWYSVTYGNGMFVAVANSSSEAAYSTNGSTWTVASLPGSAALWNSVTYGNGVFVAVAYGTSAAAYSSDGSTWTGTTLPSSSNWRSVTYGDGRFVAVPYGTSAAAYSSDGSTWTGTTLPSSVDWQSVTYGNGLFVAVAYNSAAAAYSSDGTSWTGATLPSSSDWYSIAYGNGAFVAISDNSISAYSTDGSTWASAALPSTADWSSVAYGNGVFVAVAFNSATAAVATSIAAAPAAAIALTPPLPPPPSSGPSSSPSTPTLSRIQVTAASLAENYGAAWSPSVTVSGLQNGDSAAVIGTVFTYAGTNSTAYATSTKAPTMPGTYSVTPSLSTVTISPTADAADYDTTIEFVSGTLDITAAPPTITSTSTIAHRLVFNAVLHGQTLQGATSVTINGGTARIISHGEFRLVVRIALAKQSREGDRLAVVHFAQGLTARFHVSVVRHGSAIVVRTSTQP